MFNKVGTAHKPLPGFFNACWSSPSQLPSYAKNSKEHPNEMRELSRDRIN
jgi:hypothetical protein